MQQASGSHEVPDAATFPELLGAPVPGGSDSCLSLSVEKMTRPKEQEPSQKAKSSPVFHTGVGGAGSSRALGMYGEDLGCTQGGLVKNV